MGYLSYQQTTVALIGGYGVAGTATAHVLAKAGVQTTTLEQGFSAPGSSYSNQKWKHSGSYYLDRSVALGLWEAYDHMNQFELDVCKPGGRFVATSENTLTQRKELWEVEGWPIPYECIDSQDVYTSGLLGQARCTGGFMVRDAVIDFPEMLATIRRRFDTKLINQLVGIQFKRLLLNGNKVVGVHYEQDGRECLLRCEHCVLTAGAWTPTILNSIGLRVPISIRKSHVLVLQEELVPRITAWLDAPWITLVPYKGTTLVSNTESVLTDSPENARDVVPEQVKLLWDQLATAFPRMTRRALQVNRTYGCLKTEFSKDEKRNQTLIVLGPRDHEINGLTIALPGKASLAFSMAEIVCAQVLASLRLKATAITSKQGSRARPGRRGSAICSTRRAAASLGGAMSSPGLTSASRSQAKPASWVI